MKEKDLLTNELVEQVLTVLPLLPKKVFGNIPFLQNEDLHPSHFHILHIVEHEGPIKMSDISKKLGINKSNLSPLVHKLLEKQLISRVKDEQDRRVSYIQMTEEGMVFSKKKKQILYEVVQKRFETLSDEDKQELKGAFSIVNRVLSKLE
ncbi:MarR family transcriptional regulator [Gracilibacillus sp. YIM 98692]|uniref:MarR family winged helix-turn-helix transcriptional regulator n=1 Tax=Gracilibacillus sp. YIM 98692 TaxID=2663532 RepID=UPI0013D1CD98|nr:MarR family transcriptional regulator [Gracilibacillus sp. YIM 98692]